MEEYIKNIIDIINKAKDEVNKIREDISTDKENIEDIGIIIDKLKNIETALKPNKTLMKKRIDSLGIISKELSDIKCNIILGMKDEIFSTIEKNLLDGMYLESVKDNENLKNIVFQKEKEKEKVGNIEVLEDNKPDIKIKVTVYENSDEFEIHDPARMYSIISFVNTKFNYKQI